MNETGNQTNICAVSVPTMVALILAYRLDPDSPYRKLRWHTRQGSTR